MVTGERRTSEGVDWTTRTCVVVNSLAGGWSCGAMDVYGGEDESRPGGESGGGLREGSYLVRV